MAECGLPLSWGNHTIARKEGGVTPCDASVCRPDPAGLAGFPSVLLQCSSRALPRPYRARRERAKALRRRSGFRSRESSTPSFHRRIGRGPLCRVVTESLALTFPIFPNRIPAPTLADPAHCLPLPPSSISHIPYLIPPGHIVWYHLDDIA